MRGMVVVVGALASASGAMGGVIFDNGAPFIGLAGTSWFAEVGGASGFSEVADDFTLAAGFSTIRDIHWWGTYSGTTFLPPDSFTITIYNDAAVAHAPGTVHTLANIVSVQRTATADLITGLTVFRYDAVVSDIVLAPGVPYWLGISNDTGASPSSQWAWAAHDPFSGNLWQYSDPGAAFGARQDELAFYLTDDIPAPGVLSLAGLGVVAAGRRRRTR